MTTYVQHGYSSHAQSNDDSNKQLTAFEQEKVLEFLKLVKWIVARISDRLPRHIDKEDLMHSGILGLMDAVKKFKWGRENEATEFKAYAECRIRGQIMDELRRLDLLPRSTRDKVNNFKRNIDKLQKKLGREPESQEVCQAMSIDLEQFHRLKAEANGGRQFSLDDKSSSMDVMEGILRKTLNMINPHTPEGLLHVREVKSILADEIDKLNERERQVISLYYLEEMTLKEIGQVLDITESRVSQVHSQALNRLMTRLNNTFGWDNLQTETT